MSKCMNKVMLIGYCGKDIFFSEKTKKVANFSLATSYSTKAPDGSYKDETEWHKITCFDKMAQIAKDFLKKGSFVYIEGTLKTSKYQDKEGINRSETKIIARELKLLDKKTDGEAYSKSEDYYNTPELQGEPDFNEDFNDDIPF